MRAHPTRTYPTPRYSLARLAVLNQSRHWFCLVATPAYIFSPSCMQRQVSDASNIEQTSGLVRLQVRCKPRLHGACTSHCRVSWPHPDSISRVEASVLYSVFSLPMSVLDTDTALCFPCRPHGIRGDSLRTPPNKHTAQLWE